MKNLLLILVTALFLTSCEKNLIDLSTPSAAKNPKEAKARLTSAKKWGVQEISLNGSVVYANGTNLTADVDVSLLYMVFKENGNLEIVYADEPTEILKYKLDEEKNILTIIDDSDSESYFEDWKIEAGSVYKDSFTMSYTFSDDPDDVVRFSIKILWKAFQRFFFDTLN
jgi:hypothetical protein